MKVSDESLFREYQPFIDVLKEIFPKAEGIVLTRFDAGNALGIGWSMNKRRFGEKLYHASWKLGIDEFKIRVKKRETGESRAS